MHTDEIIKKIKVNDNSIALVGWEEGGAGLVASWIGDSAGYEVACFINPSDDPLKIDVENERKKRDSKKFEFPQEDSYKGKPFVQSSEWADLIVKLGIKKVLVVMGNKDKQYECMQIARQKGFELINAIHPSALVLKDASLGKNVIVHARAVIGYRAEIQDGVIINTGAQIDHHNVVKVSAVIDPGVITAGNVTIGEFAHIHTAAVIINKIKVGARSVIGAGAVIIEDVPENVTVVGVPGKIIRKHT